MREHLGAILAAVFCLHLCRANPISTFCQAMNDRIDADFAPCLTREITLSGPRDRISIEFLYGMDALQDVTVTIYVRALVGTVTMSVAAAANDFLARTDTTEGPAVVKLTPKSSINYDWSLQVYNTYGTPSKFVLQITTDKVTTVADSTTKAAIKSIFEECCKPSTINDIALRQINDRSVPCDYLQVWSSANASTPDLDVCQDRFTYCTPRGALQRFSMQGFGERNASGLFTVVPAFNAQCLAKPPAALADLVELVHLELLGGALEWTVADVVNVTKNMNKLERLYLGVNRITGQMDESACALFQNKPNLTTLSFRNDPSIAPPWNAISGSIHNCVFNTPLQHLNLVLNQVSGLDPIPAGTASPMQSLRLMDQMDPLSGMPTMRGKGWPAGLSNLPNLVVLGLAGNQLGGPPTLSLPTSLEWLNISDNALSGSIPTLGANTRLSVLDASDNPQLQGDIASIGLSRFPGLVSLDLSNTSISGNADNVNWLMMPHLEFFQLSYAGLTGGIPSGLAALADLQALDVSHNPGITSQEPFASALPPDSNITYYDVSNCAITDLPDGLQNLKFFRADVYTLQQPYWGFNITRNRIHAVFPEWLASPIADPFETQGNFQNNVLVYAYAVQSTVDANSNGNHITCPWQPFSNRTVVDALQLQQLLPDLYNTFVTCYNGSQLVPVASQLQWLATYGPAPAPPPPPPADMLQTTRKSNALRADKGPSNGAVVGIVLGTAVGVGMLVAIGIVVMRCVVPRWRQRGKFSKFNDHDMPYSAGPYVDPNSFQMAVQMQPHGGDTV